LPLSEIIATVLGAASPSTQAVWKMYNLLVGKFGDEYTVLIDASEDALAEVADAAILGVAGSAEEPRRGSVQQLNLADFW